MLIRSLTVFLVALVSALAQPAGPAVAAQALVWDAMEKTLPVKPGEGVVGFEFQVTNKSDQPVSIAEIRPSCGCTVAEMPTTPWVLAPGAKGSFRGTIDIRGKHGTVSKSLYVISSAGQQALGIVVNVPESPETERREVNQALSFRDRQTVFKGDCARCHVEPTQGKMGAELFAAACGICHLAEHRASMVPDLAVAQAPRDAAYWRKWISEGKEGSLMPGFAQRQGGPLNDEQIASLVEFVVARFPVEPRKR
jgi:cytochrome c553